MTAVWATSGHFFGDLGTISHWVSVLVFSLVHFGKKSDSIVPVTPLNEIDLR
jgi:hypothetical protein